MSKTVYEQSAPAVLAICPSSLSMRPWRGAATTPAANSPLLRAIISTSALSTPLMPDDDAAACLAFRPAPDPPGRTV